MPLEHSYRAYELAVKGIVQGVGFRPFVFRCARRFGLHGWVENRTDAVYVRIEGPAGEVNSFTEALRRDAPAPARIASIESREVGVEGLRGFSIRRSSDYTDAVTDISPDIAVCEECLADMKTQPRRINYPFINCSHCGPRFTIITGLPYDRPRTTMARFAACQACRAEYHNSADRRFHAQPIACSACGPSYTLHSGAEQITGLDSILSTAASLLEANRIVAIRGLGGFHLACNALSHEAVSRLRAAKRRDAKPFAVMFRDLAVISRYADTSEAESELLLSPQRPIVVLENARGLAPAVSAGFASVGAMLPYLPFHYLLFERLRIDAVVMTSGNMADEPIAIDNDTALATFSGIADAIITHNRDIYNRADDSVAMVAGSAARLIRRSRGYVPQPVHVGLDTTGILACGALLKNCFALGAAGGRAILSQHIGNLDNAETYSFFTESVERFTSLFRMRPSMTACDLHPDYLSSRYGRSLGLPCIAVQHHHAHIAACMAEHGLDEPVIGVSFDGAGLGDDGTVWGGEFLRCDLVSYTRTAYLKPVALPGGDRAAAEPWRMALSYLHDAFGTPCLSPVYAPVAYAGEEAAQTLVAMIQKKVNAPLTSSMGRLFDAVASLLGLCHVNRYEAEAAMALENAAGGIEAAPYPFAVAAGPIDISGIIRAIAGDIKRGVSATLIAAKFQATVVALTAATVKHIAADSDRAPVVLSGGVFQNRYILEHAEKHLRAQGFRVYTHCSVPSNDGGIALGQLAVAAKRRTI